MSRDRAGFEVRDVHPSHYGRICPVETPEGPNIGLIASLATFARINDFGFLETPYRKVENGRVTDTSGLPHRRSRGSNSSSRRPTAPIDDKGHFTTDRVVCRCRGDFIDVEPARVDYMDVSPKQLVSVAASLDSVPRTRRREPRVDGFEHATPGRAAARHRSAVRGTGLEDRVARDSRAVIVAEEAGKVASVTGNQIIITEDGKLPEGEEEDQARSREGHLGLPGPQVHALERGDLHQPEDPRRARASR